MKCSLKSLASMEKKQTQYRGNAFDVPQHDNPVSHTLYIYSTPVCDPLQCLNPTRDTYSPRFYKSRKYEQPPPSPGWNTMQYETKNFYHPFLGQSELLRDHHLKNLLNVCSLHEE